MKRVALVATVSLAALIWAEPAGAQAWGNAGGWWGPRAHFRYDPPFRKSPRPDRSERPSERKAARDADRMPSPQGPLHIIVSINKQRATLFANGEPFATTKISSGTPEHPTPMGVFSVL